MPNTCAVPNCNSNYRSSNERWTTTFSFPKDPILRSKWLKNIARKNFTPGKHSVVCEKHFSENDIIRFDCMTRNDGTLLTCKRDRPKLKEGAVPVIFPSSYISKSNRRTGKEKLNLDEQENRLLEKSNDEGKNFPKENTFDSFENLVSLLKTKVKFYEDQNWQIIISANSVIIANICDEPIPKILASLKIDKNLSVTAYDDNSTVTLSSLKNVSDLNSLSQINHSLNELKALLSCENNSDMQTLLIDEVFETVKCSRRTLRFKMDCERSQVQIKTEDFEEEPQVQIKIEPP